jgi:hypothetical protein
MMWFTYQRILPNLVGTCMYPSTYTSLELALRFFPGFSRECILACPLTKPLFPLLLG